MTSADSFKTMYKEFLNEIIKEFPDNDCAKNEKLATFTYSGDHIKRFMKRLNTPKDHGELITGKSDLLFSSECQLIIDLGLNKCWDTSSDEAKASIWQYLGTLNMLSSTISTIPANMLKSIESLASKLTSQIQGSNSNDIDMQALMKGVQNMMSEFSGQPQKKKSSRRKK